MCWLYFLRATLDGVSLETANGTNKQDAAAECSQVGLSVGEALADPWAGARALSCKPLSVHEVRVKAGERAGRAALRVAVAVLTSRLTQRPAGRARAPGQGCRSRLEGARAVLAISAASFLLSLTLSSS